MLLAISLIAVVWLGLFFLKGNAADMLKAADEAYKSRNYDNASQYYSTFVNNFSGDETTRSPKFGKRYR